MENSPNNSVKVPYDPGWNDPPTFSYNAQQTTPSRPRNFLNKRVAFPVSGDGLNLVQPPPVNLPPMPTVLIPQQPVLSLSSKNNTVVDTEVSVDEVKSILLQFLNDSIELGSKANDIKRRIDAMSEMWINGKLNNKIHIQMKELACALRDDKPREADDIHRALMVDHVSSVGTWMPGVKQLIHHSIARSELLAIDKE